MQQGIASSGAVQAQERLSRARAATFKKCAEALIASHESGWRNSKHREQWSNTLVAYAYPVLEACPWRTWTRHSFCACWQRAVPGEGREQST